MNIAGLRRHPESLLIGAVCFAILMGAGLRLLSGDRPEATATPAPSPLQKSSESRPGNLFEQPMVNLSLGLRSASPRDLLPSTPSQNRLSFVEPGRLDPFAPVMQPAALPQPAGTATVTPSPSPGAIATQPLPPAPVAPTADLPPLPGLVGGKPAPLPPIPLAAEPVLIPALPSPVALSPLQGIVLTGVVQVGDRLSVIVREPGSATSRHTFAGEYLAGGLVRVKRIEMSAQEPLVILEYNGREYPLVVGASA
jgi:hypothetical protein